MVNELIDALTAERERAERAEIMVEGIAEGAEHSCWNQPMKKLEYKVANYCAKHSGATLAQIAKGCQSTPNAVYYWVKKLGVELGSPGAKPILDQFSNVKSRSTRHYLRCRSNGLCVKCGKKARVKAGGGFAAYCSTHAKQDTERRRLR